MVTGGITVSDSEVRSYYVDQGTKIKFDYAVINSDDVEKQINPTDAELQTFFKTNAAKYANAIPESRKISYIAFSEARNQAALRRSLTRKSSSITPSIRRTIRSMNRSRCATS